MGEHSIQKKQVEMSGGDSMETSKNSEALWYGWQLAHEGPCEPCKHPRLCTQGYEDLRKTFNRGVALLGIYLGRTMCRE